jgi:hypothetical protein
LLSIKVLDVNNSICSDQENIYFSIVDENEEQIGPAGMERLCKDLQVAPEDVSISFPLSYL